LDRIKKIGSEHGEDYVRKSFMFGTPHQISVGTIRGDDVNVTYKLLYMQAVRNILRIFCEK
jgi:hypothetical protein